jgi:hypothetical protein
VVGALIHSLPLCAKGEPEVAGSATSISYKIEHGSLSGVSDPSGGQRECMSSLASAFNSTSSSWVELLMVGQAAGLRFNVFLTQGGSIPPADPRSFGLQA